MAEYKYLDVVKLGTEAANAREPRLQPSVPKEFAERLSDEVSAGEWTNDNGTAINSKGQTVEEYLDFLISARPHWEVPAAVIDEADDTWTSGSLSKQGARWKKLRAVLGSDAATNSAMAAEAEVYGAKVGSTKPGIKVGEKSADEEKKSGAGANNPWSSAWSQGEKARTDKIASILKQGTAFALSMAKSAGRKSITDLPKPR